MKKNIFKFFLCLSAAMIFVACDDTMDDKAAVDASHQVTVEATTAVAPIDAANVSFASAVVNVTLSDLEGVVETGVEVSASEDFSNSWYASAAEVANNAEVTITGLEELTTYYIRPYIYTANGATIVGEKTSFTTIETPPFPLDGVYAVTEYATKDAVNFTASAQYEMTIAFAEGSETEVLITNLWEGGETIVGTYDAENQVIVVADGQVIMNHPSYGPVVAFDAYGRGAFAFEFTPKGGKMQSGVFGAECAAGFFGYSMVEMQHQ